MRALDRVPKKPLVDFLGLGLLGAALRNPLKSSVFLHLGFGRRRVTLAGCILGVFQKPARALVIAAYLLAASTGACGYRFLDAGGPQGVVLASVRNASPEPGLAPELAGALDRVAGIRPGEGRPLDVVVTRFGEKVAAIDSDGRALRQAVSLELSWRLGSSDGREAFLGSESVSRTYPASTDAAGLGWARQAAISLLVEDAARAIADRLAELP